MATELLALLPPGPGMTVAETPGVLTLVEAARRLHAQTFKPDPSASASVIRDKDLDGALVLEFIGRDLQLVLPCKTHLPILTLHIMDVGKFLDIELSLLDADGALKHMLITNRQSTIRASADECSLPLSISPGSWSLLRLNLPQLMDAAFGKGYSLCAGVVVHASCRLGRVFFADRECADAELPAFLRVLGDRAEAPAGALVPAARAARDATAGGGTATLAGGSGTSGWPT
jgi:hypothetical protein